MDKYSTYLSPFSWRYGSDAMRRLWSEEQKRRLWRLVWLALAEVQAGYGLVNDDQLAELRAHVADIDIPTALEKEAAIRHDLMAELLTYAGQCPQGGKILHLGATSMDIEDNAEVLRQRQSVELLLDSLNELLGYFVTHIETWADYPVLGYTHLQPAEPTTLGYRLALYAQDLETDWRNLRRMRDELRGKGFKGAVGSGAAYADLLGIARLADFEVRLAARLDLPFYPLASQVYPRRQDYDLLSVLAGLGASLYRFAFDLRILQSTPFGEWSEPFGEHQVGSSAMPFKRNPIQAEKIDSLARQLAQMPRLAWDNAAHSLLERTLDDSANRRTLLPEAFLICDELLRTAVTIVSGLNINEGAIRRNLAAQAPFAATERILMALVKAGADRQEMHARLRRHALAAWEALQAGQANPLAELIARDTEIGRWLAQADLGASMDVNAHLGDAPQRARAFAAALRTQLA